MSAGKFFGLLLGLLVVAFVVVWVFVSLAALLYALGQGDGGAAGIYAVSTVVGLAVGALGVWVVRRMARARSARQ
ncbi:hypothetical protein [Knoellia subterranea]|uniref:Uncharacterized protein n=1 Tax=Knoellia subterranea KCTC 19937 TaxID=1385521 RepID=A0A0A0JR11_9MICO|nr:hypothetical protein [Knoellia subterranea]KGN39633.1 hypothetical protein N803_03150 [Knoellia subterranea KCTC 19937]